MASRSVIVGPLLGDGRHGAPRGVSPRALPAPLDILPPRPMALRVGADVLSAHPDLVIWRAGGGDSPWGLAVDRCEAKLREGIEAVRATGTDGVSIEPQWSPVIEKADAKSRFVEAVLDEISTVSSGPRARVSVVAPQIPAAGPHASWGTRGG